MRIWGCLPAIRLPPSVHERPDCMNWTSEEERMQDQMQSATDAYMRRMHGERDDHHHGHHDYHDRGRDVGGHHGGHHGHHSMH